MTNIEYIKKQDAIKAIKSCESATSFDFNNGLIAAMNAISELASEEVDANKIADFYILEAKHTPMRDERDARTMIEMLKTAPIKLTTINLNEAKIPRWINVEDELPKRNEYVLVVENGRVIMASFDGGEWTQYDLFERILCCPTYWMPLPEPPNCGAKMKGENDEQADC